MTPDWLIAFVVIPVSIVTACALLVLWTGRADKLERANDAAQTGHRNVASI